VYPWERPKPGADVKLTTMASFQVHSSANDPANEMVFVTTLSPQCGDFG